MIKRLLTLEPLRRYEDFSLLMLRIGTGSFLVHGVWDNLVDAERMREFTAFLTKFGFPAPELMAPLSVYAQFGCGLLLGLGLLTRWAGLVLAFNFVVAIAMVDRFSGIRGAWPALALVLIGLHFSTRGAGRFSLDQLLRANAEKQGPGGSGR